MPLFAMCCPRVGHPLSNFVTARCGHRNVSSGEPRRARKDVVNANRIVAATFPPCLEFHHRFLARRTRGMDMIDISVSAGLAGSEDHNLASSCCMFIRLSSMRAVESCFLAARNPRMINHLVARKCTLCSFKRNRNVKKIS